MCVVAGSFISATAFAQVDQTEELRIENNDLRRERPVFEVLSHQQERDSIRLLEVGDDQYLLDVSKGARRLKVSSSLAQKADGHFVKKFIQLKYEMESNKSGDCQSAYTLSLRGEVENVCSHETAKLDKVSALIQGLKKELKIK